MTRLNAWLALVFFAAAVYGMIMHPMPGYIKLVIVVGAYFAALQWLGQYYPRTAQWIASTTFLLIFELVRAVLSVGGGRRR